MHQLPIIISYTVDSIKYLQREKIEEKKQNSLLLIGIANMRFIHCLVNKTHIISVSCSNKIEKSNQDHTFKFILGAVFHESTCRTHQFAYDETT